MNNVVPLVIYKGGERVIVGTAVVDELKLTELRFFEEIAELTNLKSGSYSLGPVPMPRSNSIDADKVPPPFPSQSTEDLAVGDEFHEFMEFLRKVLPPGKAKRITISLVETAALWARKALGW